MDDLATPLLVFADDWGRHPSSCQYLVSHLLDRHPTHWINTIGTRKPRFDRATLSRGLEKLRAWARPRAAETLLPPNLQVHSPKMWPWFRSGFDRRLNRCLLGRSLRTLLRGSSQLPVAVTTLPIVADLIGVLPVRRWVYYCVDDFSEWPGLDGATLRRMEEDVVRRVEVTIAVSETLQEKLARLGREAHLLTHGVDLERWQVPAGAPRLSNITGLEHPLIAFWGVVDRRLDLDFVRRLANALPRGTIVLAGPEADPDPALGAIPRLARLGALPFRQLAHLAASAEVLIMPYADIAVTRAMQPLKLKEYLATGKPVVVRDLPATRSWADCLDLAASSDAFGAAVLHRLTSGVPQSQERGRKRLAAESWAAKARQFERWAFRPITSVALAGTG